MEIVTDTYRQKLSHLQELIEYLLSNSKQELKKEDVDNHAAFIQDINDLEYFAEFDDTIEILSTARDAANKASTIGLRFKNESKDRKIIYAANKIIEKASQLVDEIDSIPFTSNSTAEPNKPTPSDTKKNNAEMEDHEKTISNLKSELDSLKTALHDLSTDNANRQEKLKIDNAKLSKSIEKLELETSKLEETMLIESKKASSILDEALIKAKEAQENIDKLLETTSSKVLLLEYSTTADSEEISANKMRRLSLICMLITGAILTYVLYETLNNSLDWKQSILKMLIALALSIPAAYLARESAKHRTQQHISRRIALDLKAVTPYISSLPQEDQIKIKSEVASRIFGVHNNLPSQDSYPINTQELVTNLIDKIPKPS